VTEEEEPGTANRDIRNLILKFRTREPVATTRGTFYIRHITIGDLKVFNDYLNKNNEKASLDFKALAELSLKVLVCADNHPENTPAITEEIYTKLTDDDIKALAAGVAKACNLGPLPEGDALEALGAILFDYLTEQTTSMAESAAKIKQKLDKNFGSLSESLKATLGENLSALSAIRESLKMSPAVEAMRKVQEQQKQFYGGLSAIQESLKMSPHLEAMRKAQEDRERLWGQLPREVQSQNESDFAPATTLFSKRDIDVSSLIPPKYEETPAGRAANRAATAGEESARQLQEVAGLAGQMAEQLAKLQTVFLMEVLPQWQQNIKDSSDGTNKTLNQTKISLYWAVAALIVSLFMTGAQLWIGHQYKLENDAQQNTSESLMRQQLAATQELNKRLIADATRRTEEPVKLNQSVERRQTLKGSESMKPKVEKTVH
jgi:hypothetical protein